MHSNLSIDADPQQQAAASPRMLVVRSFLRYTVRNALVALIAAGSLIALAGPVDVCTDAYRARSAETEAQCFKLASSGDLDAEFGYGLVLLGGHGRESQPRESLKWLRLAAEHGHLLARVMLGRLLSDGEMLAPELRNPVEGYAWWVIAGEREAALTLSATLSGEQRVEAQRTAVDFQSKYGASK